jgi:acylphosphatase
MTEQRIINVSGLVQGVMFRASAQRVGMRLGLTGFAENQPDGSVLIVAEGPAAALDELVVWCKSGPPKARVDQVDVKTGAPAGYRSFTVAR